jgi:hypothetical protein
MRASLVISLLGGLVAGQLTASTIHSQLSTIGTDGVGQTVFQYNYIVTGLDLFANQELDIQFDPTIYSQLLNGVAGPGFSLLLFQPNSPPQAPGDYSALAIIDHPSFSGPFSVQFTLTDLGLIMRGELGPQVYVVNQYDSNGAFKGSIPSESGSTSPGVGSRVPEPSSLSLTSVGLMLSGVGWALRRRLVNTP